MRSRFAILGHPIHPMLVPIPIGLFVWTLIAGIVYAAGDRDQLWYDIAFWSGIAAVCSAIIAALPGFGDFFTMDMGPKTRTMATVHMVLNLTVVALFFIAAMLMLNNNATEGGMLGAVITLHAIGVALVSVSGWLGGEMVYRYGAAVEPEAAERQRLEHTPVRGGGR